MKRLALIGLLACAPAGEPLDPIELIEPEPEPEVSHECQASDQAFARRAILALSGRLPEGVAELRVVEDELRSSTKRRVARALMEEETFRERWSDFFMDALRVARNGEKSLAACYGAPRATPFDDGALARWVRDHRPFDPASPTGFSMNELLSSALELDDLSVIYRAHLFAALSRPLVGNASPFEMEVARRNDFGASFESSYLHRDVVCLACHNSEFSVTSSDDPETNRFWPIEGRFERALYGSATGTAVERTRGAWRHLGVVGGSLAPFGWSAVCGTIAEPATDDPLGVDTYFGSVRGVRTSIVGLEESLHRGVDALASHGLARGDDLDPDEAFAYLVAANIVDRVWTEVIGTPLTIATGFPRTQAQRDVLESLTDRFVASHFSLKELLLDIVTHPAFNPAAPSSGCGYRLPRLFDPWTDTEVEASRLNSPADRIASVPPRVLRRALHRAMSWPDFEPFPTEQSAEEALQIALGFYLRDGEPGRRDLDFQGRLAWEAAYGACAGDGDFISSLAERAESSSVLDAVVALKDRLLQEPHFGPDEAPLIEALIELELDTPGSPAIEPALRRYCGVLVSTPQIMLSGPPPEDGREIPRLTPPGASYDALERRLRERLERTSVD